MYKEICRLRDDQWWVNGIRVEPSFIRQMVRQLIHGVVRVAFSPAKVGPGASADKDVSNGGSQDSIRLFRASLRLGDSKHLIELAIDDCDSVTMHLNMVNSELVGQLCSASKIPLSSADREYRLPENPLIDPTLRTSFNKILPMSRC